MPHTTTGIVFGPYRLDVDGGRLWKDGAPIAVQPRPLAVLSYLAERPGRTVGRDELIARVWAGTHVTKAVLKVAVRALREALADDASAPRWIETVGREGYRFIAPGEAAAATVAEAAPAIVGRDAEVARLQARLAQAATGARAVVLVSGEAGIGKTTLLDRFVDDVVRAGDVRVARGQCLEQYGEGEAYLPVLEALGALARADATGELRETLAQHAPTWVPQLAALEPESPVHERRDGGGATAPARMLREIADALEVLTARRPLLLVLEDVQWSDPSTVDLIGCLARRRPPARLLVLASMRPADTLAAEHPLRATRNDLRAKGLCDEIALALLSRADVAAYVRARFAGAPSEALDRLAARVHERTDGNPLFMVNMLNDLVADGLLVRRGGAWRVDGSVDRATDRIPSGLGELLDRSMRGLARPVRQVLEAASVAGDEFAVGAVAAAVGQPEEKVEDVCEQLASDGSLVVDAGVAEWPDGSVSGRYRFRHALYRRALYEGVAEARRVRLHVAIAGRHEAAFGARAGEHAAELAMHFTRGRAHARALRYHELAAAAALERHAPHEAVAHQAAALDALARAPDVPEGERRELRLVVARATLLMSIHGYAASETERAFAQARALCDALPPAPERHPVLRGLVSYHTVRAELDAARRLGEELLIHAGERPTDRALHVQAHYGHGATLFHMGAFDAARGHLEAALREYDPATHRDHIRIYGGYDPGVACELWLAWTLTLQGELGAATAHDRAGLALAHRHGDAFSLAWAHHGAAVSRQFLGDWAGSEAASTDAVRLAEEQGFPHVLGMATANRGWALMMQGKTAAGIAMLRDGVATVNATGAGLLRPSYLGMLAAAHVMEGDRAAGAALLDEALAAVDRTGERLQEAGLLVAKSNLVADGDKAGARLAEDCLRRAVDVARSQGARLLELRAAVALARHCRRQGRTREAEAALDAVHAWFAGRRPVAPETAAAERLLAELRG